MVGGGLLLASLLIVTPVQASTLSQSQTVTVTGGHFYTYMYWQEVQTGTQQVQVYPAGSGDCIWLNWHDNSPSSSATCSGGFSGNTTYTYTYGSVTVTYPVGGASTSYTPYNFLQSAGGYYYYAVSWVSQPTYTTEPVYTNEPFTGTAWSPATITYS